MIDIAPGRQTKSTTVKITGIETVPVAPENLTAVLINSSEDDLNEFYTVKLSWTPKSYNEDGYILKIYSDYDADSKAVVTTGTPVVTLKNTVKAGETDVETFVSSNYYVSGNLGRATKECEIKLPTGTLFNVTLKSWNDVGESESVCTLSDATAKSGETAFTAKFIGRTRVTYNLNGGVLNGSVANVVKFFTFNPTKAYDVVLSGTDKLVKDKNPFKYWTSKINGSEAEKIESYDGYNDLTVWAAYNVQAEIDYTVNDVYTELALASVMNGTEEVTADTAGYLVKEDDSTEVTFTVGDDTDSYNYVKVYGNGMEIASGTGRTVTMDLSKVLEGGTYNVTLIAFDGTKKYSCNVVLVVAKK